MKIELTGRKTLVIGGARGIGAQIVRACAAAGSDVAWSYLNCEADLKASAELTAELVNSGVRTFSFAADCTSEADTVALYKKLDEEWGGIDALVYSAGFTNPRNFCDITFEEWKKVVDINLNGAFLAIREAIPMMRSAGKGSIVIIGSAAIVAGGGGRADYAAAKAGLEGLNRAVTKNFAPENIRCNIVHPSLIETDLLKQRHPDPAKRAELGEKEVPLRRLGQPEDIASAALFLLSDAASYVTGQSLYVDGGRTFCK
ncbi:MAG: SDR family oxidoreductase [Lentisphaerae bacterium]|nr:SDR family oxidoreductase [Lentisphaerota bacterium]